MGRHVITVPTDFELKKTRNGTDVVRRVTLKRVHPSYPNETCTEIITLSRGMMPDPGHLNIVWTRETESFIAKPLIAEVALFEDKPGRIFFGPMHSGSIARQYEMLWLLWAADAFRNDFNFWKGHLPAVINWCQTAMMAGLKLRLKELAKMNFGQGHNGKRKDFPAEPLSELISLANALPLCDCGAQLELIDGLKILQTSMTHVGI